MINPDSLRGKSASEITHALKGDNDTMVDGLVENDKAVAERAVKDFSTKADVIMGTIAFVGLAVDFTYKHRHKIAAWSKHKYAQLKSAIKQRRTKEPEQQMKLEDPTQKLPD